MTKEQIAARRQELLIEQEELQLQLDHTRTQVSEAKRRAATTGDYSDRDWFTRAEAAIRHKGREIKIICGELSALKAEERALNVKESSDDRFRFEKAFMRVCRRRLSGGLFASLVEEANEEASGEDQQ